MNRLKVNKVNIYDGYIEYDYKVQGEWKKYFNLKEKFKLEYSQDISGVPYGIGIIPLLCNILPMAWIFDAEIIIDEIDEDFYNSIPEFKKGYSEMYPQLELKGRILVNKINKYIQNEENNVIALFSGGVDAFHTLLSHIQEKPCIATVWGSDIKHDDIEGWNRVLEHTKMTSEQYQIPYIWIKSSFRMFINEGELHSYVERRVGDGWWHGFQHGIGLIGHIAPYAYKNNIKTTYIASSFTIQEKGKVTCASDPTIDNYVRFSGCQVVHDGYDYNRQQKISNICKYAKENKQQIPLRVCWQSSGGSNCCKCEKCYRTLFAILAEKYDPRNFGFNYSEQEIKNIIKDLKNRVFVRESNWKYIQDSFRKNYKLEEVDNNLRWFYKKDVSYINKNFMKKLRMLKRKLYQLILRK